MFSRFMVYKYVCKKTSIDLGKLSLVSFLWFNTKNIVYGGKGDFFLYL